MALSRQSHAKIFWFSLFLTVLFFSAAALFLVAEYHIAQTGYTPNPVLGRFCQQVMDPFSQWMEPILAWLGLA